MEPWNKRNAILNEKMRKIILLNQLLKVALIFLHGKISERIAQFNATFIKNDLEVFHIGPCHSKIKNKKREPEESDSL